MAKVSTEPLVLALPVFMTAARAVPAALIGSPASRFFAQITQGEDEWEEVLRLLGADQLIPGFYMMKEAWDHHNEAVNSLEHPKEGRRYTHSLWLACTPEVKAVGRAFEKLGDAMTGVLRAIGTPGATWTPGERLFVEEVLHGDIDHRVYFRGYSFNPPSLSTFTRDQDGNIVSVEHHDRFA